MNKLRTSILYILAIFICICISAPIFSQSIYIDEAYSIEFARGTISSVIENSSLDDHPPLYYLLIKFAEMLGGESITKYRFVSLLPAYLNLIFIGATYIRKHWNWTTSAFYILWFGAAYSTFSLSIAIRMYSWACFFVTAACLSLHSYYHTNKKNSYVISIFLTLGAMYTHYYALFAMLIAWSIFLVACVLYNKKEILRVLIGGCLITICYLPWLIKFLTRPKVARIGDWTGPLNWKSWFLAPSELMASSLDGISFILYMLILGLIIVAILQKNKEALLSLSIFGGTMILGAIISILLFPIWVSRFMYIMWGMLSLFVALVVSKKKDNSLYIPQFLLLCILFVELFFSIKTMENTERMLCDSEKWINFLNENIADDACVIVDDPSEHIRIYRVYMPNVKFTMTEQLRNEDVNKILLSALSQAPDEQCWFIMNYTQGSFGVEHMQELLNNLGYDMTSMGNYAIEAKNMEIFHIRSNQ